MSDYIIATTSTSDLPRTYLDEHKIPFLSYNFTINETAAVDDCREENRAAIYAGMRKGDLLTTSMINAYSYEEFFRDLLKTGKNVLFLDMSEKMSKSYQNCQNAAEIIRAEFPDRQLYVMDTRCISGGLGLLVMNCVSLMEAGVSFEDVIAWGEENKLNIAHRFTVDDLNYLKRGGRVSNTSALVGSLLNIKPVLYVPDEGTLNVVQKARGRKKALEAILSGVLHDLSKVDTTGREMLILHADCLKDAEYIRDNVKKTYPDFGDIRISSLGVVIGAHCGPGLLAIFYLCSGRQPD
ncbi:MAG: DegV family protein [Oscillospiraceae bacterium]|nr:DegV family protein [Oscillospiraceae bacterium]